MYIVLYLVFAFLVNAVIRTVKEDVRGFSIKFKLPKDKRYENAKSVLYKVTPSDFHRLMYVIRFNLDYHSTGWEYVLMLLFPYPIQVYKWRYEEVKRHTIETSHVESSKLSAEELFEEIDLKFRLAAEKRNTHQQSRANQLEYLNQEFNENYRK